MASIPYPAIRIVALYRYTGSGSFFMVGATGCCGFVSWTYWVPVVVMYWGPAFQEMLFSRMNDIFAKDTQKSLQKRPGIQRKRAAEVTGTIATGPPIAGGRKRKLKVEPTADSHVAATGTPAASEHSKKTPKGKESPAVGVLSSVNVTNELRIDPAVKVEETKVEEDESLGSVAEEGSNLVQPQLIAASFVTVKPGETVTTVPLKKEEAAVDLIEANAASDTSSLLADETVSDSGSNRLISAPPLESVELAVSANSLERDDLEMTSHPDLPEALQAGLSITPKGEGPASSDLTKSLRKVRLAKKTTTDVPAKLVLTAAKLPPTTDVTDKLSLTASPAKLSADASPGELLVAASPVKVSTASASPIKLSQAVTPAEHFVPASPGKLPTSDSSAIMSKANLSAVQLSAKLPAPGAAKLPTAAEKVDLAAAVPLELQLKLLPVTDKLESEENSVVSTAEPSGSFLPPVNTTAIIDTGTTTTLAVSLTPQDQTGSVVSQAPPLIASAPAVGEVPSTADGPTAAADPVRSGGGVRRTTLGTEVFDFTDDEDVDIPLSNIDFDALNSGIITATAGGGAVVPTAVDLPRLTGGNNSSSSSSSVPLQISIPPPSPGNQALEAGLGDLLTPRHKVMTSSGVIHHHHYVHHRSSPLKNVFDVSPAVLSRGDAMAAVEAVVGGSGNDTPPPPQQQHSIHLQVQQQIGGHRRPSGNSVQNMDIMSDDTDTSLGGGGRTHGVGGGGSNSIEQQQQQQQQRVKLGKRRRPQRRIQDASDGDGDTEDDQLEGGAANSRSSRDTLLSGGGRPKRAKTADSVAAAAGGQVPHHAQPPSIAAAATTRPSSAASGTSTASGGRGGGVEGEGVGGPGRLPTVEEDDGKQSPDSQRSNEDKSRWKFFQNFSYVFYRIAEAFW
jgi:hypothetical protein